MCEAMGRQKVKTREEVLKAEIKELKGYVKLAGTSANINSKANIKLFIECENLKAGIALFSKSVQLIGLELIKMHVKLNEFLVENKNDGQKTGR